MSNLCYVDKIIKLNIPILLDGNRLHNEYNQVYEGACKVHV